jgi:hypothetical protein
LNKVGLGVIVIPAYPFPDCNTALPIPVPGIRAHTLRT